MAAPMRYQARPFVLQTFIYRLFMLNRFIYIMLAVVAIASAQAKDDKNIIPPDQWFLARGNEISAAPDGHAIYYPKYAGGDVVITAQCPVNSTDAAAMMTAAVLYAMDNEATSVTLVEPESNTAAVQVKSLQGTGKDAATYMCTVALEFQKGQLMATACDISVNYKEKGIIPRTVKAEKLNPGGNQRHAELADGLAAALSAIINDIAGAAAKGAAEPVTHWPQILNGEVVKGMNETEVILAKGRPFNVSTSGGKTKWRYNDNSVVIFTKGVVSRTI